MANVGKTTVSRAEDNRETSVVATAAATAMTPDVMQYHQPILLTDSWTTHNSCDTNQSFQ